MEAAFSNGTLRLKYPYKFLPINLKELSLSDEGKPYQAVQLYSRDNGGWFDVTKIIVSGTTAIVTYEGRGLVRTLRI